MNQIVLNIIFLLFSSLFLLKITDLVLRYFNFYSHPTDRGLHKYPITTSGGVYFVFYILFIFIIVDESILGQNSFEIFILLLLPIIFGLIDDKKNLNRKNKLFFQLIISLIILFFFNFKIFQNLFPFIKIDYIYFFLNIIFIIGLINFINFIDGSDGNLTLFIFFIFVCLVIKLNSLILINQYFYLIYLFPFLISFYFFNIQKKIFLGESGSFFLSIFLILHLSYFVNKNIIVITDLLIVTSYFISDMVITFFLRIYHYGFNSFKAHRDHAYQHFCYLKKDHKKINIYMFFYNFIFILPLYLLNLNSEISDFILIIICYIPSIIFVLKYSPLVKVKNAS